MSPTLEPSLRRVFLRDLEMLASIGVYPSEQAAKQRIRVNLDLWVDDTGEAQRASGQEDLAEVVDYALLADTIRGIVQAGHVRLVETLAERIARASLEADIRIGQVCVRVEKPDVFADIASVGVEIIRSRGR